MKILFLDVLTAFTPQSLITLNKNEEVIRCIINSTDIKSCYAREHSQHSI